ncbi:MAG TPA: Uma2 family endonuclease [Thermoanaerobaculia bacterium]|jgi:Uma2 family endonuclease|nr:Uma2 family endonuclease [Thermoanaerobaculia bacterium]
MAARVREKVTYEDLLKVPDNMVAEIIDGELYSSPRPGGPHSVATSVLIGDLNPAYQRGRGGPGGWWILVEPELHLGLDVLVPDIAGWRRERMPEVPRTHIFSVAPDWICEVLSPSTIRIDRAKKMRIYAEHDVTYAWLLDPVERFLEVKRLENDRWMDLKVFIGNDKVIAEPFPEVEIDLTDIWGPTPDDDSPLPPP